MDKVLYLFANALTLSEVQDETKSDIVKCLHMVRFNSAEVHGPYQRR